MAKYLIRVSYTVDGVRGVAKEGGSARLAVARKAIEGAGGKMEAFYFAFGDDDAVIIADMPDNASAAAVAVTVGAGGGARCKTTPLLTPEEFDKAAKMSVPYRAPGA